MLDPKNESLRILEIIASAEDYARAHATTDWLSPITLAALATVAQYVEDIEIPTTDDIKHSDQQIAAHERLRAASALHWILGAVRSQAFCLEVSDTFLTGRVGRTTPYN